MKIYTVTTILPSIGSSSTVHPNRQAALDTVRADVTAGPDITDDQLIEFAERNGAEVIIEEHDVPMTTPKITLITYRHPDSNSITRMFIDGVETTDYSDHTFDPGYGLELHAVRENAYDSLNNPEHAAMRSALLDGYNMEQDSKYTDDDMIIECGHCGRGVTQYPTSGDITGYLDADFTLTCDDGTAHTEDEGHITLIDVAATVKSVIAGIREKYPTATSFEVSSSDQGRYGYWLTAVKFDDSTVITTDSGTFEDFATDMQDEYLDDLSWGSFGDTNAESGFDVDMSTGRIIR